MLTIDQRIKDIDKAITDNIALIDFAGVTRALISQNLLGQSRNLVEHIAVKISGQGADIDVNWDTIKKHFFNKEPASVIKKTIKLKVKEASKNAVKIDALDEWNVTIADFEVSGDEVDSSLEVGDTITI